VTGEVIKSFLVGLGFGVDDASLSKFNKAITSASLKVTALYASIKILSGAIVYSLSKISEGFEQMGYEYRIIAPAINKALVLRRELLKAYSAAGINITKVVQASVKLNMSLAKTRFAFEAIYKSVASRFFDTLTKQSDAFRKTIYANMPKIQNFLERFIKFIFKALEATTALGLRLWSILTRVYDFFVMLDKATDGWSTRIIAVVAAWKLLNLSFLATPLGMLLTGFVALLALWDDFKTFQEGGKSLFNWGPAIPVINSVTDALKSLWGVLNGVAEAIASVFLEFHQLFSGDPQSKIGAMLGGIKSFFGSAFGLGGNAQANLQAGPGGIPSARPVGNNVQNSQTNQNVQQQTNINVVGSADASAVGKAVSGEQSKVNFDMVRNMKGATR
jgi:hypothetical protein